MSTQALSSPKLNGFGMTIRRIEAERVAEAEAAIAAGWTPDQHPATCCPALPPEQPKEARTTQQRREWCNVRAYKSDERAIRLRRVEARLTAELTPDRRPDSAEINIPFHKRAGSLDADITKARQLAIATQQAAHHESRAKYWRNRAQEQS